MVFAGFLISNSETGCGAFSLIPRLVVQVCRNGMTITRDALREVHLGGKLDDGLIRWSGDTQDKNLALVQAKTRDAVTTFLDTSYITQALAAIEEAAATPLTNPENAVRTVANRLRFTDDQAGDILRHFIQGGQCTAGGIMQAVTASAQAIPDADTAHDRPGESYPASGRPVNPAVAGRQLTGPPVAPKPAPRKGATKAMHNATRTPRGAPGLRHCQHAYSAGARR